MMTESPQKTIDEKWSMRLVDIPIMQQRPEKTDVSTGRFFALTAPSARHVIRIKHWRQSQEGQWEKTESGEVVFSAVLPVRPNAIDDFDEWDWFPVLAAMGDPAQGKDTHTHIYINLYLTHDLKYIAPIRTYRLSGETLIEMLNDTKQKRSDQ